MKHIIIDIPSQTLSLFEDDKLIRSYSVSTAKNGVGQEYGSECTPLGKHYIRAKIGANAPVNTVYIARRPTGEIYSPDLAKQHPGRDWILTRIMWLCGLEYGKNRHSGNLDTMRRKIYIHGTPDSIQMGIPRSRGCIRMRNDDVIELFGIVEPGIPVEIK